MFSNLESSELVFNTGISGSCLTGVLDRGIRGESKTFVGVFEDDVLVRDLAIFLLRYSGNSEGLGNGESSSDIDIKGFRKASKSNGSSLTLLL